MGVSGGGSPPRLPLHVSNDHLVTKVRVAEHLTPSPLLACVSLLLTNISLSKTFKVYVWRRR